MFDILLVMCGFANFTRDFCWLEVEQLATRTGTVPGTNTNVIEALTIHKSGASIALFCLLIRRTLRIIALKYECKLSNFGF